MTKAVLHFFPGTCAQVTAVALEETQTDYELAIADLRTPETRTTYAAINPKGKVPALAIDGHVLVENPAILWFLDERAPGKLFPRSDDPFERQHRLADLVWCASALHPMVRQVRMPQLWTHGDPAGVAADGTAKLCAETSEIARRVGTDGWWYGSQWSIVDTYIWWCFRNAQRGNMDLNEFPVLLGYLDRIERRASTVAVLDRQTALGIAPVATSHQRAQGWSPAR